MYRTRLSAIVVICCAFMIPACGAKKGTVTGTVTFKTVSLTYGQVHLIGSDGQSLPGVIDENGKYQIKNVPYGKATLFVIQRPKDFKSPSDLRREWKQKGEAPPEGTDFSAASSPKSMVPEKYSNPETSGLKVTVEQSTTKFDIALTDD